MKLNIEVGDKYVITGTSHDLVLSVKKITKDGPKAGQQYLSRVGYYNRFEKLVRELCFQEILTSEAQSFQALQQHIDALSLQLGKAVDDFVSSKS